MDYKIENDQIYIDCGHYMDINTVEEQKATLSKALLEHKTIILVADKIQQIDTASLQTLLIFTKELDKKKISWKWQSASLQVIRAASALGLVTEIRLK